jgi:hypothetical protein
MRCFLIAWLVSVLALSAFAAEPRPAKAEAPKSAKTREEILASVEKIRGYGIVQWTETSQWGRRILAVYYCPFSGRAATYLHAYYYDGKQWHVFCDRLLEATHKLSVELPADKDELRCRGADGTIIHTESLDKIPKFYDEKREQEK